MFIWKTPDWSKEISKAAQVETEIFSCEFAASASSRFKVRDELRNEIRAFIARTWKHEFESKDVIYDLKSRPQGHSKFFSISHSGHRAVVVASAKRVGIDIEEISRVNVSVADRMSTASELISAPSAAHLWTAKEAYFKCLPEVDQPNVISQIEIFDWKRANQTDSFSCKMQSAELANLQVGRGATIEDQGFIVAIATI